MTRRLLAAALVAATVGAGPAFGTGPRAAARFTGGSLSLEGFDKCQAPASSDLRSWLVSPYRAVNIYFGGNNRACADQPELTPQWLATVTSNGWAVIPTYVGSQAACTTSSKTNKISASTAAAEGTSEADDAANGMAALGLPGTVGAPVIPVYFDMEPYSTSNSTCDQAVLTFLDAWTRELHVKGYLSGVYGTVKTVISQLVTRQGDATFAEPDDIWYAHWYSSTDTAHDSTTDEAVIADYWSGHRIHQWVGGHNETFNGNTFDIDRDRIDGDVVAPTVPAAPQGPPYVYAAAPPAGSVLREHSTPTSGTASRTGVTYSSGTTLEITCQTVGDGVDGDEVWDKLSDGAFVSDIFTTTTGGLSFTEGVARCDTVPPTATLSAVPPVKLAATQHLAWSGTDDSSGVATYDVRYRRAAWNGGFGAWTQPASLTATPETSATIALSPGYEYCAEVRATDRSGNVGPWSNAQCLARALDDRSLAGGSGWNRLTGRHYYLHTVTSTHDSGVQLQAMQARATRLALIAMTCPKCGSVQVRIGRRVLGDLSLVSPQRRNHTIFVLPGFSLRTKTVHIAVTSTGKLVRIDGLAVSQT